MPGTVLISGVTVVNKTEDKVSVFLELTFRMVGRGHSKQMSGGNECTEKE